VLEANEEVALVSGLLGLFLVRNWFDCPVAALVPAVDLFLQLLLRVATWDVLDAEVRAQVLRLLHELNPHWLVVVCARVASRRGRAGVLGARRTLRVIGRLLVRFGRVLVIHVVPGQ